MLVRIRRLLLLGRWLSLRRDRVSPGWFPPPPFLFSFIFLFFISALLLSIAGSSVGFVQMFPWVESRSQNEYPASFSLLWCCFLDLIMEFGAQTTPTVRQNETLIRAQYR